MTLDAAIVGIGTSRFGRGLPESQLKLAAIAFNAALADAGLERSDVDGLSIHLGWPLGPDYDRVAEAFGLDIRYVNQSWLHGRFITNALQHAALAVSAGLADVVACVTAVSFTRERGFLGGPGDIEGNREEGGTHGEAPPYGLTAPAGGATCIFTARPARSLPRCRSRCASMRAKIPPRSCASHSRWRRIRPRAWWSIRCGSMIAV
jgi:hypothetical protein